MKKVLIILFGIHSVIATYKCFIHSNMAICGKYYNVKKSGDTLLLLSDGYYKHINTAITDTNIWVNENKWYDPFLFTVNDVDLTLYNFDNTINSWYCFNVQYGKLGINQPAFDCLYKKAD